MRQVVYFRSVINKDMCDVDTGTATRTSTMMINTLNDYHDYLGILSAPSDHSPALRSTREIVTHKCTFMGASATLVVVVSSATTTTRLKPVLNLS